MRTEPSAADQALALWREFFDEHETPLIVSREAPREKAAPLPSGAPREEFPRGATTGDMPSQAEML